MSTATARATFRTALIGILTDFQTANPTMLRQVYAARPATFYPPCAYVGQFSEPTIEHEFGNRQARSLRGQLVIVHGVYENRETLESLDVAADALITYLASQHARADATKLLQAISAEDADLVIAETTYAATLITVSLGVP